MAEPSPNRQEIRVWRVKSGGRACVFDDMDVALGYLRAELREGNVDNVSVESDVKTLSWYREAADMEDGGVNP